MKKLLRRFLAFFLLLTMIAGGATVPAEAKTTASRTIAIVFDNSGSMYMNGNQAWCRATYAMEVFASMLNDGDTLLIYPMHPISVDGKEYSQKQPLTISDPKQSSIIREIYTDDPGGTPIDCIDAAAEGLRSAKTREKWLIVLTDGSTFDQGGVQFKNTAWELGKHINACVEDMNVLYLGIGYGAAMPSGVQAENYSAEKAVDSNDVLSILTKMCNQIFGRDTFPPANNADGEISFDISMKKLIVFVQGKDVSGVKLTGSSGKVGTLVSSTDTKYAINGCNRDIYVPVSDETLQGMLVTYEDCPAGEYTIEYSGTATSIEVYYEPDADLAFVFTDANGNVVDPNAALYEGDYKVSYGLKDAKTGALVSSALLGNPVYTGYYSLNGKDVSDAQKNPISHTGMSGEERVALKVGDIFYAKLTVTYLSGYTITKDSIDFGWPTAGVTVVPMPPDELRLEITGGDELYRLATLEEGGPYTAKIYYNNKLLTGEALEQVSLKWDPDTSNAEIKKLFQGDHYDLNLHYKDPGNPQATACGECSVIIYAYYTAPGSSEAAAEAPLTYNIEDVADAMDVVLSIPNDYLLISELGESAKLRADIMINGAKLTDEQLAAVDFDVDCGGIDFTTKKIPGESAYSISLEKTDGIKPDTYTISCSASGEDNIGRSVSDADELNIKLSRIALWIKWLIWLGLLLLLLIILLLILHIKALPTKLHTNKRDCAMTFDGEDITKNATFDARLDKKRLNINSKYGGRNVGLAMDARPAKGSYIRTAQGKRSAEIISSSVKKQGNATITNATIGNIRYVLNEETHKLERIPKSDKPFVIRNGARITYSGIMQNNGENKEFSVVSKLNFKKK